MRSLVSLVTVIFIASLTNQSLFAGGHIPGQPTIPSGENRKPASENGVDCPPGVEQAIHRSVKHLDSTSQSFGRCFNCHNNTMPAAAMRAVQQAGFKVPQNAFLYATDIVDRHFGEKRLKYLWKSAKEMEEEEDPIPGNTETVGSAIDFLRFAEGDTSKDGIMPAFMNYAINKQISIGTDQAFWFDDTQNRQPSEGNPIETSENLVRGLVDFGGVWAGKDVKKQAQLTQAIQKAARFMIEPDLKPVRGIMTSLLKHEKHPFYPKRFLGPALAELTGTQSVVSRLRALSSVRDSKFAGKLKPAIEAAIGKLTKVLVDSMKAGKEENTGCWSQLPKMECDSYATGTVLVALAESGLDKKSKAFQSGVAYLVQSQDKKSGAWPVMSRSQHVRSELREMEGKLTPIQRLDRHLEDPPLTEQDMKRIELADRKELFDLIYDRKNGGIRTHDGGFALRVKSQFITTTASAWSLKALSLACEEKE